MQRFEDEALYGGAAGGDKSDCGLAEALRQVDIPYYRSLITRSGIAGNTISLTLSGLLFVGRSINVFQNYL